MNIKFYNDDYYYQLIKLLKDADMYDKVWETRKNLQKKIQKDSESILVAIVQDTIVGCIFIMEDGWNAILWRLCVKEGFRKQGIGGKLLQRAEEIIKARDLQEASLLVNPDKQELVSWYKKKNYEEGGKWKFMYKNI